MATQQTALGYSSPWRGAHGWTGQYLVDEFGGRPNVKVIHLGDFADMPSLSSYDKGNELRGLVPPI